MYRRPSTTILGTPGVDNTPDRTNELTYSYDDTVKAGGKGDLYLDFIEQTVLPTVYSKFRAVPNRDRLGILGSSLGGLISCYAGWTRPQVYSRAGCMSSSFWWNNEDFNNDVLAKKGPSNVFFYLDSGNAGPSEDDMKQTLRVRDHMVGLGYTLNSTLYYYLDNGGEHNESFWRRRFHIPLSWLYPGSVSKARPATH
jgi:predicted alpha/beta superfamily hydrolase